MRPILIIGVLLFTALTFYSALWFKSEDIEADITTRVTEDLEAADAQDIDIDVDGRHVTLSGVVFDEATETSYLDTANETYGALGPIDGLTLQNGGGFLKAVKSPQGITLTGAVPSETTRTALLEAATTSTEGNVVDGMTIGAAPGAWTDEAGFGLAQLAQLKEGALSVAPDSYTLSGVTDGSADDVSAPLAERAGWQSFVTTPQLTTGLSEELDAAKGRVSDLEDTVATLEGAVSTRDGTIETITAERDTLSASLRDMTGERDAALEQGDASTADVAAERDRLTQKLAGLSAARDVLSETVTGLASDREGLEQSVATLTEERDTAITDLETLRASLDDTQSSTATLRSQLSDTQAQLAERDAAIGDLNAEIETLNGRLSTQIASLNTGQQEDAALRAQIAEQTGTIDTLSADNAAQSEAIVRLQGELDASDEAKTAALAQVEDFEARLAEQSNTDGEAATQIAALTDQVADLQAQGDEMAAEVTQLSAVLKERDATIADLRATASTPSANAPAGASQMAAQCSTRAGEILQNAQINFSSGTANIRGNSIETLERLTGIALACSDSGLSVEIGGHTDSQGSDESNQNLSERRAQAIAQFMVNRGVPEATLSPVGFGEAQPIGDNATAEGRQQNRRISFEWQAR